VCIYVLLAYISLSIYICPSCTVLCVIQYTTLFSTFTIPLSSSRFAELPDKLKAASILFSMKVHVRNINKSTQQHRIQHILIKIKMESTSSLQKSQQFFAFLLSQEVGIKSQ